MKKNPFNKFLSILVSVQFLATTVLADVPSLPRDESGKPIPFEQYGKLNEHQQKEFGAFMLFYELVSSGKIGGNTGLCLSYSAGGNGASDKISIGLDSKSYPTGIYDIKQVPVEKIQNLQALLKDIGHYLDSGCQEGQSAADCRAGRSVNITGYADAQHYGAAKIQNAKSNDEKSALIERSISENIRLSENRARMFSQLVDGEGFVDKDKIAVAGRVSPMGEYLQEGLPVPEKYQSSEGGMTKSNYKVNCPERRVTVIDVNFNGQPSDIDKSNGFMSPVLKSASKNFVRRSNMGASIQTFKAAKSLGLKTIKNDSDADKLIDKILDMNGVKSQSVRSACKNLQARSMVKEHLKMMSKLSQDAQSKISSTPEVSLLKLSKLKARDKEYAANAEVIKYFQTLPDGYGGSLTLAQDRLIGSEGGLSTSLNDCFSAKAAMQLEFDDSRDPAREATSGKSKLCQPVGDHSVNGNLDIKFDPKELHDHKVLHIGCQACQTGFRYTPEKYINPETGKEETQMVPVFIDREMNISDKANPALAKTRPIEPKEVEELVANKKALEAKLKVSYDAAVKSQYSSKVAAERNKAKARTRFLNFLIGMNEGRNVANSIVDLNPSKPKDPATSFTMGDLNHPLFQSMAQEVGIGMDSITKAHRVMSVLNKPVYGAMEKDYLATKLAGRTDVGTERYEKVLLPGIKARDVLTNWNGDRDDQDNTMLFGSLKKPRYYLLEDCNCESENLMEQAEKSGKLVTLDRIPGSTTKEKLSKNACIISMPLPPSCMVNPNEQGTKPTDDKGKQTVRWMGLNGQLMNRALSEMSGHFSNENKKVTLTGCEGLSPMQIAERVVESAECAGESRIPQGETFDCKK